MATKMRRRLGGLIAATVTTAALTGCQPTNTSPDRSEAEPSATPAVAQDFTPLIGTWREPGKETPMVLTFAIDGTVRGNFYKSELFGRTQTRGGGRWRVVIGDEKQEQSIDDIFGFQYQLELKDPTHLAFVGSDDVLVKQG